MLLLLVRSCLCSAPAARADDSVVRAIEGLQARYAAVQSVSAEFRQTYRAPGIEQVESGRVLMKKPGLMRWEYRDPELKYFIADGHDTYLYTPADRQVMVSQLSESEIHSTPLQFLLGRGDILKSYAAAPETEFKPSLGNTVLVRLTPRSREPDYTFLVLECDRTTFTLRRIIIREVTGNTSEFLLSNLQTNMKIDNNEFHFKIPKGVEVVRLDER